MRQRKLLKRFVASPMRRSDFLLALASSRLVLMLIDRWLPAAGLRRAGVSHAGDGLVGVDPAGQRGGALSSAGLGLLTASRAQKIETVSGLINVVMMPMWIFSGVFFSYERFPAMVHPADPGAAAHRAQRCLARDHPGGRTLSSQLGRIAVLVVWGGVSFVLALRWFRWS